jgi:hypothetical protein
LGLWFLEMGLRLLCLGGATPVPLGTLEAGFVVSFADRYDFENWTVPAGSAEEAEVLFKQAIGSFLEARGAGAPEVEAIFDGQDLVGLRLSSDTFTLELTGNLSVDKFTTTANHPVAVEWYIQEAGWGELLSSEPVIA